METTKEAHIHIKKTPPLKTSKRRQSPFLGGGEVKYQPKYEVSIIKEKTNNFSYLDKLKSTKIIDLDAVPFKDKYDFLNTILYYESMREEEKIKLLDLISMGDTSLIEALAMFKLFYDIKAS